MAEQGDEDRGFVSEFLDPAGHEAVSTRMRSRKPKKQFPRKGGTGLLDTMFDPDQTPTTGLVDSGTDNNRGQSQDTPGDGARLPYPPLFSKYATEVLGGDPAAEKSPPQKEVFDPESFMRSDDGKGASAGSFSAESSERMFDPTSFMRSNDKGASAGSFRAESSEKRFDLKSLMGSDDGNSASAGLFTTGFGNGSSAGAFDTGSSEKKDLKSVMRSDNSKSSSAGAFDTGFPEKMNLKSLLRSGGGKGASTGTLTTGSSHDPFFQASSAPGARAGKGTGDKGGFSLPYRFGGSKDDPSKGWQPPGPPGPPGPPLPPLPPQPPQPPPPPPQSTESTGEHQEYSNEARCYHARYAELDQFHGQGRLKVCREGCLDLLTEPRLPKYTRIQTLQMVSTLLRPAGAEACLLDVDRILNTMDPRMFQTQLLREDNEKMLHDLALWQDKGGRMDIDSGEMGVAGEVNGDIPSDAWVQYDRDLEDRLRQETEEELEPFGAALASMEDVDMGEQAQTPPLSSESDTVGGDRQERKGDTGMLSPSSSMEGEEEE